MSLDSLRAAARDSICLEGLLSTLNNSSSESTSGVLGVSLNERRFFGRGMRSIRASSLGLGGALAGAGDSAELVVIIGIELEEAGLAGRLCRREAEPKDLVSLNTSSSSSSLKSACPNLDPAPVLRRLRLDGSNCCSTDQLLLGDRGMKVGFEAGKGGRKTSPRSFELPFAFDLLDIEEPPLLAEFNERLDANGSKLGAMLADLICNRSGCSVHSLVGLGGFSSLILVKDSSESKGANL